MNESQEWQSWAAIAVVVVTLTLFVMRAILRRRKGKSASLGCASGGCDCGPKVGKSLADR